MTVILIKHDRATFLESTHLLKKRLVFENRSKIDNKLVPKTDSKSKKVKWNEDNLWDSQIGLKV